MMQRLKHIKRVSKRLADGRRIVYYYHRLTGKRIVGDPGTPEFMAAYAEASIFTRTAGNDTIADLIVHYRAGPLQRLAPRTRTDYEKHLARIYDQWGDAGLKVFEDRRIRGKLIAWRDELATKSLRQTDYTMAVLRLLLEYGHDQLGMLKNNHARGIDTLYRADRADRIWLPEQVSDFLSVASVELQAAMLLGLHTGQRQGDLLRLRWTAYDGKGITLRQSKGGRHVYIPCTSRLQQILEDLPRKAFTVLTNSRGQPWTSDGFRTSWWKASRKAGIVELTYHDLRGTAVTMLSEAGCSEAEIAAISGHTLRQVSSILDRYLARTRPLAEAAILKFENALATKSDN